MLTEFHDARKALRGMGLRLVHVATDSQWADREMLLFLEEHEGHALALQNEYGDVKDIEHGL